MLISDAHAPGGDTLTAALGDRVALRWDEVVQHVPIELAERARKAVGTAGVDRLVSVGGGSATGLAKAIALDTEPPTIAVSTTYAGSGLTPVYGMTGAQCKLTGTDERIRPAVVVYDPELTLGLPFAVTGPSAFNAMAHCFAALWSPRRDLLTSALAVDAIRSVATSLPVLTNDRPTSRPALSCSTRPCWRAPHSAALDWVGRLQPFLGPDPARGLWDLARACALSMGQARLGARREHLREVAHEVVGVANPVPVNAATVEALLGRALDDKPRPEPLADFRAREERQEPGVRMTIEVFRLQAAGLGNVDFDPDVHPRRERQFAVHCVELGHQLEVRRVGLGGVLDVAE
jgi:maleylacetate reductase